MHGTGQRLSRLAGVMERFPQVLRNVEVADRERLDGEGKFWAVARDAQTELGDDGRILVRPSGTEPLVRVMVEAPDGATGREPSPTASWRPSPTRVAPSRRPTRPTGSLARHVRDRRCGASPRRREPPDGRALVAELDAAVARAELDAGALLDVAALVEAVDAALRGVPGVRALVADPEAATGIDGAAGALQQRLLGIETDLDVGAASVLPSDLEAINAALVRCKDAVWAVRADRLRTAREVGRSPARGRRRQRSRPSRRCRSRSSALDRLEVRGRDSAGLHVLVHGHGSTPTRPS